MAPGRGSSAYRVHWRRAEALNVLYSFPQVVATLQDLTALFFGMDVNPKVSHPAQRPHVADDSVKPGALLGIPGTLDLLQQPKTKRRGIIFLWPTRQSGSLVLQVLEAGPVLDVTRDVLLPDLDHLQFRLFRLGWHPCRV